jgi:hypothetical protein
MKAQGAEWWVQKCLAAAAAAASKAADRPGRREPKELLGSDGYVREDVFQEHIAVITGKVDSGQSPQEAASQAFLCEMPALVSRANTKAFIACVAAGLAHRYLSAIEGKSLMYSAQLALAAFRQRRTTPHPHPSSGGQ